ncbi:hypothetical protein DYB34_007870, partial [Aphanomyces astaci]
YTTVHQVPISFDTTADTTNHLTSPRTDVPASKRRYIEPSWSGWITVTVVGGSYTSTVYGHIRDQKYDEAVRILQIELQNHPCSRAALSLLGYCFYHMQSFHNAVSMYEQLCKLFPDIEDYHLYYAQALYKVRRLNFSLDLTSLSRYLLGTTQAGQYDAASRKASQLESEQYSHRVALLRAAVYYEQNDIKATQSILDQCLRDDPTTIVFDGAIDFKEGRFEEAKKKFGDAMNVLGYQSDLCYNIALCFFRLKQYGNAMRQIAEIIEKGVRDHPELSVGSKSESNSDVKSVRNSTVLRETALVEAFNLKAAIEYDMKNFKVSLHNFGLMNMDVDPNSGFKKLNFLLQNPPFPVETFSNLLLLSKDFFEFVDASVTLQTSPEEAYRKYDDLATKHVDVLRKLTQKIQAARIAQSNDEIKHSLKAYDDALEDFMPATSTNRRFSTTNRLLRSTK